MNKLSPPQIAWRLAQDLPEGAVVNLGSGMPQLVAGHIPGTSKILLHREPHLHAIGSLHTDSGSSRLQAREVTASQQLDNSHDQPAETTRSELHKPTTANPQEHVFFNVLGACQVSEQGDVASRTAAIQEAACPADMADHSHDSPRVLAMMELFEKDGTCRLVHDCTLPVIGKRCVTSIYTDLAVFDIQDGNLILRELVEGITLHTLQAELDCEFQVSPNLRLLQAPALQ